MGPVNWRGRHPLYDSERRFLVISHDKMGECCILAGAIQGGENRPYEWRLWR